MTSVVTVRNLEREMGLFSLATALTRMSSFGDFFFFFFCTSDSRMSLAEDLMWFLLKLCVLLIIGTVPGSKCQWGRTYILILFLTFHFSSKKSLISFYSL